MKMITGILGCALVAGLMTFAADKAQAGVVIANDVYSPLKLKITAQYLDGSKIKTMSISSKDVLKDLGYNSNVQLASASYAPFDIWVINKDTLVQDLSTNDTLYLDYEYVVSNPGKNGKYNEAGVLEVYFSSDMSSDYFDVYGVYSYSSNTGKTSSKGTYKFKEMLKSKTMSGYAYFPSLSSSDIPVTGSASYNGSGTLTAP
jgi:hypothetical protein